MDIHLLLDRKSLRLIDVEDAARLLAARTEQIYLDAIKKRLQQDKNNQPKEITNAN
jgi:flagellar biogenesis protein FliO